MSCNNYEVFNVNSMLQPFFECHNKTRENVLETQYIASFQAYSSLAVGMNLFNHILIVMLTLAMVYKCWLLEFEKTALHAHLCTIGFVFLMAEGLMVRYGANVFLANFSHESKTLLHALFQFIGGFLGIVGTLQKYWGKEKHFKSRHAKFGLAACCICFINFVAGFCALILPSCRGTMKLFHGSLGLITFITGMLAQIFGYDTGFFHRNFSHKRLWKFVTFMILALTVIGPFKTMVYRIQMTYFVGVQH